MAINKKLIHFQNLADFETRLANNEILNTSIVFIKDAKKIWTHGNYYDGSTVDLTDIENSIQNILDNKVDKVSGKGLSTNDYTTEEKNKLAGAYTKPSGGIPKNDLASAVQTSLGKADTALQAHQDISGKQDILVSGTNIKTINGESILGEGDITIDSINTQATVIETTSTTLDAIQPNVVYRVTTTATSLVINSFSDPVIDDTAAVYSIVFNTATSGVSLSVPEHVVWANGTVPTIEGQRLYELNFLKTTHVDGYNIYLGVVTNYGEHLPSCCFVADTEISMADGTTKRIADIQEGDLVLSLNMETNELETTVVKNVIVKENITTIAEVQTESGKKVVMNEYHPLLTKNGWHSITNYDGYDTLVVGDKLRTIDGLDEIVSINRYIGEPTIMYNLDVKGMTEEIDNDTQDNYIAGGIFAHNTCEK